MKENAPKGLPIGMPGLLLSFLLLSFATAIHAHQESGTVADSASRHLSNATVHVKGTSRTTVTDDRGRLNINAAGNDVLVFTSVGFLKQEVPINGNRFLNVSLTADVQNMEAIVVTALGIKKEARKLGYSATTAKLDEIQQNRTNNVAAALEGKIAGLDIAPPSAGPASSNKLRIRVQSAFAGADNGPLTVINGLPMSQGASGASGGGGADNASRDRGDNLLLVNLDDIESMIVLKPVDSSEGFPTHRMNKPLTRVITRQPSQV